MELWEVLAREAVRHTVSAYTNAGDRGRLEDLAARFTTDGSLQIGDDPPIAGRAAIIDALGAILPSDPSPPYVHHHVSSIHFLAVTPEAIDTASYFLVLTDVGIDHWGRYRDRFQPDGDRWLLLTRRVTADGFAPVLVSARIERHRPGVGVHLGGTMPAVRGVPCGPWAVLHAARSGR